MSDQYDIVIIGGGMVGLSLAVALGRANFSVAVIESREPQLHWETTDYDARVSAIHLGTHAFLESLAVWPEIRSSCYSPLERMVIWDALGGGRISFEASDIAKEVLGYIVENREITRVLWEACEAMSSVHVLSGVKPQTIQDNKIVLDNHHVIESQLMIGADGAHSWLREQMDTACFEKPYHHDALVAVIETEKPHFCTAYQPFLATGPLGVLPLSDAHRVAIVWSADKVRIEELMAMALENFDRELTNALNNALGKTHCVSHRKSIPLMQRHAKRYIEGNKVLVGDAAHTIHPLAGQGANLGFMDAACLASVLTCAKKGRKNITDYKVLRRYERWRKSENAFMLLCMSGFKSIFSDSSPITCNLRSYGFNFADRFTLLKRYFMKFAVHKNFP